MKKIIIILTLLLFGCPLKNNIKTEKIMKDNYEQIWRGTAKLQPAKYNYVTSPSDGYITSFGSGFGSVVQIGDPLLEISAPKIREDFVSAVIDYLRSKDKYEHQIKKLEGEKQLLDAGILSEEDYWGQSSNSQDAFIAHIKSEIHLKEMAQLIGIDFLKLANLKLDKQNELVSLLAKKISVHVIAQMPGLLLPSGLVEGSKQKNLELGLKVEKGEILAAIAEQGRFKINLLLPEDLGRIISKKTQVTVKLGLSMKVPAKIVDFHPYMLRENSGTRVFPVNIEIITPKPPMIVPEMYFGMPVEVSLNLGQKQTFKVPVAAVKYDKNRYYLEVIEQGEQVYKQINIVATDDFYAYVRGDLVGGTEVIMHD